MNKIHELAEIVPSTLNDGGLLIRYNGACAYVVQYNEDGFRFHANPFLSDWFETLDACKISAIDYLFTNADKLVLLERFICLIISSSWTFKHSEGRLTIITPSGDVAVVDRDLKIVHATDADIQCGIYGFITSVIDYTYPSPQRLTDEL